MTYKRFFVLALAGMLLLLNSCKKEETIENTPVSQIEISEPPPQPEPPPAEISPYNEDGVYKINDTRIYNTVIPFGAVILSENEEESRFHVPNMNSSDISNFLEKYFPYQRKQRFVRTDIFEVYPELLPEFNDDAIIATTDPNIIKPIPETAVYIRIFWNLSNHYYEWIYQDPIARARHEQEEKEAREKEAQKLNSVREIEESEDIDPVIKEDE